MIGNGDGPLLTDCGLTESGKKNRVQVTRKKREQVTRGDGLQINVQSGAINVDIRIYRGDRNRALGRQIL